jgi:hypothetical protein
VAAALYRTDGGLAGHQSMSNRPSRASGRNSSRAIACPDEHGIKIIEATSASTASIPSPSTWRPLEHAPDLAETGLKLA